MEECKATIEFRSSRIEVAQLKDHIYSVSPESGLFIGKRNLGHVSNYYLGIPIDDDEVAAVQAAAERVGIDVLNTRLAFDFLTNSSDAEILFNFRVVKNDPGSFTLLVASADKTKPGAEHEIDSKSGDKVKLKVEYGDFSADLCKVNDALKEVPQSVLKPGNLSLKFILRGV